MATKVKKFCAECKSLGELYIVQHKLNSALNSKYLWLLERDALYLSLFTQSRPWKREYGCAFSEKAIFRTS